MSQEPKKRHSRQRQGTRRASIILGIPATIACSNCGYRHIPHIICPECGFYRGTEMVTKAKRQERTSSSTPGHEGHAHS